MPKYRVTFVSRRIEVFEVEAESELKAKEKVYEGKVEPMEVVEIADGITEIEEIE
ncbi:hypothetical protein [Alicyclobacillus sendaiensis]|uniref:Uncharacterized protein n=1 Tax=Alicyclobacillus sendaiensis PA2 TaxID=3029425 RepID=A0ABT6Y1T6_ALISE|nr:hypothetical protein [Alicyclobacillus sendaiensis]MDI9261286.1 hypothetical protein [Alicyclobacillus sendaiensis PA2]